MSDESRVTAEVMTSAERPTILLRLRSKITHHWRRRGPITVLVVFFAIVYISMQEAGHGWGDDFALYINQAKSLVNGNVGGLVADTRYAVENSSSATFSPYVYPWGFPILLAPFYLVFGLNYTVFKLVTIASLCGFLYCFHRILVKRIGPELALLLTLVIATSRNYWGWTDSVTSDFSSLLFVGVTLVFMERCRDKGLLSSANARSMIWLGLLLGWTFSIRRETIALVAALATMHLVELWKRRRTSRRDKAKLVIPWKNLARPYWVAAAFVTALQLVLPSSFEMARDPGGLSKLRQNFDWYYDVLAESLRLKEPGNHPVSLAGSTSMGSLVLTLLLILAGCGVVAVVIRHRTRDLHLIAFGLVTIFIVFTQPFHESRYLLSTIPLLLYFATQTMALWDPKSDDNHGRFPFGHLVAGTLLAMAVVGNGTELMHAVDYHHEYNYVIDGPETASSQQLFDAVRRCTRGDDIVLFAQARSMNLYTGRRSIQSGSTDSSLQRADWLALTNDDVDYFEPEIDAAKAQELGLVRVWHNNEYSLYRVDANHAPAFVACAAES